MKRVRDEIEQTADKKVKWQDTESSICHLCGTIYRRSVLQRLVDDTGFPTETGAMLNVIVNPLEEDVGAESTAREVCKSCFNKIQDCFALMVMIKTGEDCVKKIERDYGRQGFEDHCESYIYGCKDCGQEVIGKENLIRHRSIHVEKFGLGAGGYWEDLMAVEKRNEVESFNKYDAKLSIDFSTNILDRARNILNEGATIDDHDVECDQCSERFRYLYLLELHQNPSDLAQNSLDVKKICSNCKNPVDDRKKHICDNIDDFPLNKGKIKEIEDVDIRCFVCGQINSIDAASRGEPCMTCLKKLKLPSGKKSASEEEKWKRKEKFCCKICGAGYPFKYMLQDHVKVHQEIIPPEPEGSVVNVDLTCEFCKTVFEDISDLREHEKIIHKVDKDFCDKRLACNLCGKKFADSFALRVHVKVIHGQDIMAKIKLPEVRELACPQCDMVFKSESAAKTHVTKEHGLSPLNVDWLKKECEICHKVFANRMNLLLHINNTHLNVKLKVCDICGMKFGKTSSLIIHKLRHTGEKPFQCEVCGKSYRQRHDVVRHLARHVRDQEADFQTASAINTSNSDLVSKRQIFLKDSTMKGLVDTTMQTRRRAEVKIRKSSENVAISEPGQIILLQEDDSMVEGGSEYEQLILEADGGETILMNDNGEVVEGELVTENGVQYIRLGEEKIELNGSVMKLEEDEEEEEEEREQDLAVEKTADPADLEKIVENVAAAPIVYQVLPDGSFVQQ